MLYQTYPFHLPPLPYAYEALEPYIEAETMHYHYDKHFQNYINGLNTVLASYPDLQKQTLITLLSDPERLPSEASTAILNNGGGVYNHFLYFNGLAPVSSQPTQPEPVFFNMVNQSFGSMEQFQQAFSKQAMSVFGSGWTYLIINSTGNLEIVNMKNQDTLLAQNQQPVLLVDVWEHAYYLQYKNLRAEYLKQIWNILSFPNS